MVHPVLHVPCLARELRARSVELVSPDRVLPGHVLVDPRQHAEGGHPEPARREEPSSQGEHGQGRGHEHGAEDDEERGGDGEGDDGGGEGEAGEDEEGAAGGDCGGSLDHLVAPRVVLLEMVGPGLELTVVLISHG